MKNNKFDKVMLGIVVIGMIVIIGLIVTTLVWNPCNNTSNVDTITTITNTITTISNSNTIMSLN